MISIRHLIAMGGSYKMFKRNVEIYRIFMNFGFHDIVSRIRHKHPRILFGIKREPPDVAPIEVRFRELLEALGPTFIKLGQILSTRADLLPLKYLKELAKLQENVPPFAYEEVKQIVESQLHKPILEAYVEFDPVPIAAASIGQAHRAILPNGDKVIVKVQRPHICAKIELDLELLALYAKMLSKNDPELASMQLEKVAEEFSHSLRSELDYYTEFANASTFAHMMKNQEGIYTPRVYADYSTEKVITIEQVEGVSCAKLLKDPEQMKKYDLKYIADCGAKSILSQIFDHGFYHADPHPGNLFIRPDGTLSFIDFGMMGHITAEERLDFINALSAMLKSDFLEMTQSILKLVTYCKKPNIDTLQRDVRQLAQTHMNMPLSKLNLGSLLQKLQFILSKHRLALRPDLYMMFKSIITIESLGRLFDPDMKMLELIKPFIYRAKMRAYDPRPIVKSVIQRLPKIVTSLAKVPEQVDGILKRLQENELIMNVEHKGLDSLERTLRIASDRIAFSIVIAAILIGSALIAHAKIPPLWGELPILGIVGFALASFLGLVLLLVIWKER